MENFIKNLKISNFKSIREAELECGRVNLFVGKPNVGKSNVLEALSLLGANYSTSKKFMSEFIRYKTLSNCFFYNDIEKPVLVSSDIGFASLEYKHASDTFKYMMNFTNHNGHSVYNMPEIKPNGTVITKDLQFISPVKNYVFQPKTNVGSSEKHLFFMPPFGKNLFSIIETNGRLLNAIANFFEEYNLDFVIDPLKRQLEIQRKIGKVVHKIPYELIADTLQRMIFYYAAIFSNKDSVILFEEPESHSFLPYVRDLAYHISQDERNQYFITTHSPHFLKMIVKEMPKEVAVFITYYEDYETKCKKLTVDDIEEMIGYGIDIFFNSKYFLDEPESQTIA